MAMSNPPTDNRARLRAAARRAMPSATDEMVDEVAEHLAIRWQVMRDQGAAPEDADRQVLEDLAAWRTPPSHTAPLLRRLTAGWSGELRHAWRLATRRPAFSIGTIVLTAIAVASIVATFALAYGLFWRPLPYPSADRLAVVWQVQQGEAGQVALADFRDISGAAVFDASTLISGGRGSLRIGDRIERVNLLEVDPSAFPLLGARPQLGRLLAADDVGRSTVLISDRLWRSGFGADPDILGRPLWVSARTYTVAGVLPPSFDFELPVAGVFVRERHDLWTLAAPPSASTLRREFQGYEGLVRLGHGVSLLQAQSAVDAIGRRLAADHPSTNADRMFRVVRLQDEVVGRMRQPLLLGGIAALVTLLIALANLVTLAAARLSERDGELAVRQALGAGTLRVRRQLLMEYTLTVAAGTLVGLGMARWVVVRLVGSEAAHLPRPDAIRFDWPVLVASTIVAGLFVLVLTSMPLRASAFHDALRRGSRASRGGLGARRALIATQVALALALSAGSALIGLGLVRLHAIDPGFVTSGTATARVSAYAAQYPGREDVQRFIAAIGGELRALPGVAHVGAGSSLPLSGQETGTSVMAEGRPVDPAARLQAGWAFVTPGYFDALGVSLRRGRLFSEADEQRAVHVSIINEALAREMFPGEDPVGRRIAVGGGDADDDWHEIVGVVADMRHRALAAPPLPRVYDLFGQHWGRTMFLVARAPQAAPPPLMTTIRRAVASVDPEAPVFEAATLDELVARSAAPHRLTTAIAAGLALTGLLLALAGVYAMTAMAVSERRHEMGVRAALGAAPLDVFWLVLRESTGTVALGGFVGMAGAVATSLLLRSRVFGVAGSDIAWVVPLTAAALIGVGVVASVLPARQAAAADPLASIRTD